MKGGFLDAFERQPRGGRSVAPESALASRRKRRNKMRLASPTPRCNRAMRGNPRQKWASRFAERPLGSSTACMAEAVSTLLLFGATGDLARRMLLPSLYALDLDGLLPDDLRIVGTARSDARRRGLSRQGRRGAARAFARGAVPGDVAKRFLERLAYVDARHRGSEAGSTSWPSGSATRATGWRSSFRPRRRCSSR